MAYYDYETLWEFLGCNKHPDGAAVRGDFYRHFFKWARTQPPEECEYSEGRVGNTRCQMEQIWWEDGEPFCKITDEMLDPLVRSKLEVPAGMVRLPHPVMLFRLPVGQGHPGLRFEGGGDISCVLATMDGRILDGSELGIVLVLFHADSPRSFQSAQPMNPDETVGAQFDRTHVRTEWSGHTGDFQESLVNVLRIVTQVSLIVSGAYRVEGMEGLINPDVLARDRNCWYASNTPSEVRERISMRAHNGIVFGREVRLPRPTSKRPVAVLVGGGRPHTFSHIRCPHFHTYLYGPGRTQIMVKYHGPIVVRPDLPPDPRPKGFKL